MTRVAVMLILQAQVCSCISAQPGLPHQKTKPETCYTSKSQLLQWGSFEIWLKKLIRRQQRIYLFALRIAVSYSCLYSVRDVWFASTCHSRQGNSCVHAPLRSRSKLVSLCNRCFVDRRGHHVLEQRFSIHCEDRTPSGRKNHFCAPCTIWCIV